MSIFDKDKMEMYEHLLLPVLWLRRKDIALASLPEEARDYMEKTYPTDKVKDAPKIQNCCGVVTYTAEVKKMIFDFWCEWNVSFSATERRLEQKDKSQIIKRTKI